MVQEINVNDEIWVDVKGYEGLYKISNFGHIKSVERLILKSNGRHSIFPSKPLKPVTNRLGYKRVVLSNKTGKKTYSIHRIVATAFIPNESNKKQVNHINGIKNDNRSENLEWCSPSENMIHAFKSGLATSFLKGLKGQTHPSSKLKTDQVLKIKQLLYNNETNVSIAKKFNVSDKAISDIRIKRTWAHLS